MNYGGVQEQKSANIKLAEIRGLITSTPSSTKPESNFEAREIQIVDVESKVSKGV